MEEAQSGFFPEGKNKKLFEILKSMAEECTLHCFPYD
jgi:hypothetical protein